MHIGRKLLSDQFEMLMEEELRNHNSANWAPMRKSKVFGNNHQKEKRFQDGEEEVARPAIESTESQYQKVVTAPSEVGRHHYRVALRGYHCADSALPHRFD